MLEVGYLSPEGTRERVGSDGGDGQPREQAQQQFCPCLRQEGPEH